MIRESLSLSLVKLIFVATIITSIGITLLIGATGYFLSKPKIEPVVSSPIITPTPTGKDETANWKIYRNKEYGFEFKYPEVFDRFEDCKLKEEKIKEGYLISLGARFSILISDAKGLSLSEYVEKEKEELLREQEFPPPEEAWSQESIHIRDIMGIKVFWFHGPRYSEMIYLLKSNKIFDIGYTAGISCFDYYVAKDLLNQNEIHYDAEIFEQISSTFRFIETEDETADWKTYRNEEYRFEIKYPKEYRVKEEKDKNSDYFWIVISTPETEKIIEESAGELTDEIFITPRMPASSLASELSLPEPIQPTEEYFSSNVEYGYVGSLIIDQRKSFQKYIMEFGLTMYTIIPNPDGTWFVINGLLPFEYSKEEPYFLIVKSLKFTNKCELTPCLEEKDETAD